MTLQWNHSVVQQPDFLTSWMASERALGLHLELHPFDFNVPECLVPALGLPVPRLRSHNPFRVRFADNFEFFTGPESTKTWSRSILPIDVHAQSTSWRAFIDEPETSVDPLHRVEPPCLYALPSAVLHAHQGLCPGVCDASPSFGLPLFAGHSRQILGMAPMDSIDDAPAGAVDAEADQQPEGQPRRL